MIKQTIQAGQKRRTNAKSNPPWLPDGMYDVIGMAEGTNIIAVVRRWDDSQICYVFIDSFLGRHFVHGTTLSLIDGEFSFVKI